MPGTRRYSSNFDRISVEDSASSCNPMHFGIESWRRASEPENLLLNGSYKHYARSASTDSLDSSGTGTTSNSSDCGTGPLQQVSMEGCSGSTRTGIKVPMLSHNPWQFVKVDPVPLYKKAVDQIKACEQTKNVEDHKKEEEEQWQRKLDSWKSRRKKVTEKTIQRVEDLKLLEQDENHNQRKSKTKTFSEIVENRAQKPRSYNLTIHGENEKNCMNTINSYEINDSMYENFSGLFDASRKNEPLAKQNNMRNEDLVQSDSQLFSYGKIEDKFEILEGADEDHGDNMKEDSAICMEEDCESCGRFTIDLDLDSFNCDQHVEETQNVSPEFNLERIVNDGKLVNIYELNGHSSFKQEENSGSDKYDKLNQQLQDNQQTDPNVKLNMRLRLSSAMEDKDFGFKIREENGIFLVDELSEKGVGMKSGLKMDDQILAINDMSTSGRSRNSVLFSLRQSVYNGFLDLLIARSQNKGSTESRNNFSDSVNEEEAFSNSFIGNSENTVKRTRESDELFGDLLKTNGLNNGLLSSQMYKEEPGKRTIKGSMMCSTPLAVAKQKLSSDNLSFPFTGGKMVSNKEQERTHCTEDTQFSIPNCCSELKNYSSPKPEHQTLLRNRLNYTKAEPNPSENLSASESPVLNDRPSQFHNEGLSSANNSDDTQQKELSIKIPKSEKIFHGHTNDEHGLTIIFHSHSPQDKKEFFANGLNNEPTAETISEKKIEHDVLPTQRSTEIVSHFDLHRANCLIMHDENSSSEDSKLDLPQKTEKKTQDNRQKFSEKLDSGVLSTEPNNKLFSSSEASTEQIGTLRETKRDVFVRQSDSLEIYSADDQMDNGVSLQPDLSKCETQSGLEAQKFLLLNKKTDPSNSSRRDEQKRVAALKQSRVDNDVESECVQNMQCQTDVITEVPFPEETSSLTDEERLFKEREENLLRRKKEIESELKNLLWEEYKLQKEKEDFRRQLLLEQRISEKMKCSSGGTRLGV